MRKADVNFPRYTYYSILFTSYQQMLKCHDQFLSLSRSHLIPPCLQVNMCEAVAASEVYYPNTAPSANCLRDFLQVETNITVSIILVSQMYFVNHSLQIYLTQSRSCTDSQHQRVLAACSQCQLQREKIALQCLVKQFCFERLWHSFF